MIVRSGLQSAQRKNHHRDAGLHVIDAGAKSDAAAGVDSKRHALQSAHGPDRIKMSQQQERLA
jgi:hypothetical protein